MVKPFLRKLISAASFHTQSLGAPLLNVKSDWPGLESAGTPPCANVDTVKSGEGAYLTVQAACYGSIV